MDVKAIAPTSIQQTPVTSTTPENMVPVRPQSNTGKDYISIKASLPEKSLQLGQLNGEGNNLALSTKETDQKLATATDTIDRMKGVLENIVKNYPPFPPESLERKELLMSYTSIRKELIKMTIPPPPPPVYEKVKHQWEQLFQDDGSSTINFQGKVASESPDSEIKTAINQLESLHTGIETVRSDIRQSLLNK